MQRVDLKTSPLLLALYAGRTDIATRQNNWRRGDLQHYRLESLFFLSCCIACLVDVVMEQGHPAIINALA